MDNTAIQTHLPPPAPPAALAQKMIENPASPLFRALKPLASLRLTVVLFVLSMFLVFAGTLAQKDSGVWTVVDQYFRSAYVWIPFQIFVPFGQIFLGLPADFQVSRSFLFPGGWLIGSLLLANLLAAHAVRFRFTWKRSGILILHTGLIIMMLGELITGLFAVEARMTMEGGEAVSYVDVSRHVELALTDSSDRHTDDVVVVPGSILRRGGKVEHPLLPVDIEVLEYLDNSTLIEAKEGEEPAVRGKDGLRYQVSARSEESGVDTAAREDAPAARFTVYRKGSSEPLGTYLVSLWFYPNFSMRQIRFEPQSLTVDGKTYTLEMRYKREYKPYSIQLLEFKHEVYPGTNTPKDFSSYVRLTDQSEDVDRESRIWMNHPMFYRGATFYQSSFLPGDKGTVLQVVRNPGWLLPYLSCFLVASGMLVHFGMHLADFLRRTMK